jgi:phosphopantetheinyl transferase (holo-ACP synthase)
MIGNDVVDLSDPESWRDACHSRFDRRVFAPEESLSLSMDHSDVQKRWILWSAKEATYKAARRESAEIAFSPARFVVDLDRSLRGSVRYGIRRWPVRVQIDGDCIHSVVSADESFSGTLSGACRLTSAELRDPSEGVRQFALSSIATELGVAISDLRIEKVGRIPQLIVAGEATPVALSLSHHGAYAGFACRDPRIEKADRVSQCAAAGKATCVSLSHDASYASIAYRSHVEQGVLR